LLIQAENTANLVTGDSGIRQRIRNRVEQDLPSLNLNNDPATISKFVYDIVSEESGISDPYYQLKRETNRLALQYLPELQYIVSKSDNPLSTALKISAAGNIIDLGIGHQFDLRQDVQNILKTAFVVDHSDSFRSQLIPGTTLLYLGDNSGEIVFDGILIDVLLEFGIEITFAVKSGPIINDALYEDAVEAGITEKVPVIETGSSFIGVNFEHSSDAFLNIFRNADIILGKGHGNFESCSGTGYNIFFLLKAKCDVVADALGVNKNDIVFKAERKI
jgi:uncharacterized protein with ATP-grasp and redox domains